MKKKIFLSKYSADRVLRRNGAQQVSDDARVELIKKLEEHACNIIKLATNVAATDKRVIITQDDINFAIRGVK